MTLRWDEGDEAASLELDYRFIEADEWISIGSLISAGRGWIDWTVPRRYPWSSAAPTATSLKRRC